MNWRHPDKGRVVSRKRVTETKLRLKAKMVAEFMLKKKTAKKTKEREGLIVDKQEKTATHSSCHLAYFSMVGCGFLLRYAVYFESVQSADERQKKIMGFFLIIIFRTVVLTVFKESF